MPLSPAGFGEVGGDNEPPVLLNKLARAHPEHEFVIVGRNSGECPQDIGFPPNVLNPWTEWRPVGSSIAKQMKEHGKLWATEALDELTRSTFMSLDAVIGWVGQHGTSNSPIPVIGDPCTVTSPQDSFVNYASYCVRGINHWVDAAGGARKEVWLCPDVRNYMKARDLKWPPASILSQFDWSKNEKHFRYGDPTPPWEGAWEAEPNVWGAVHTYVASSLELVGIPSTMECNVEWEGRHGFGIVINEARADVKISRLQAMKHWVMPAAPAWVRGKWSAASAAALGIAGVTPVPWWQQWDLLHQTRCTFTTPSSGSGWATTKPWEAFACGTVCFFHPAYDTQGHVIPTLDQPCEDERLSRLVKWLRVEEPAQLAERVAYLSADRDMWRELVLAQREHYDRAVAERRCITEIERRTGL